MAWIPWIKTEPLDTADEAVQRLYERNRNAATGQPSDLARLGSLTPAVPGLMLELNRAILSGARGLTEREQEIAALVVSSYNG